MSRSASLGNQFLSSTYLTDDCIKSIISSVNELSTVWKPPKLDMTFTTNDNVTYILSTLIIVLGGTFIKNSPDNPTDNPPDNPPDNSPDNSPDNPPDNPTDTPTEYTN